MDYKSKIEEGLNHLENICGKGSTDTLRKRLSTAGNKTELFLLWQTMREVMVGMSGGDSSFSVKLQNGEIKKFQNLKEFHEYSKEVDWSIVQ